jgi:hypothetical protein
MGCYLAIRNVSLSNRKADMARSIVSTVIRALTHEWTREDVHFHAHTGRPYPCFDTRCTRPRFDAG